MRVLVACEFSGIVRDAFRAKGHDAWSCDIIPTEKPGPHITNDVRNILNWNWDMMIAHPPCTFLAYVGNRWFKSQPDRMEKAKEAFRFFMTLINASIPLICVENPRGYPLTWFRKSDQVVHPYYFGDPFTKETHLWLKGLPPLLYSQICTDPFINWTEFGHRSAKERARTFPGIANAMAAQWNR